jgi:hypothetical protein
MIDPVPQVSKSDRWLIAGGLVLAMVAVAIIVGSIVVAAHFAVKYW